MWTFVIISWIVSAILLILILVGLNKEWDKNILHWITVAYTYIIVLSSFVTGNVIGEKTGQINALKGKFDYKMEIRYELKDSVYIPIDTVFTKIN